MKYSVVPVVNKMEQSFSLEGLQMQYLMEQMKLKKFVEKVVLLHLVENSPRFFDANEKHSKFQVCCTRYVTNTPAIIVRRKGVYLWTS